MPSTKSIEIFKWTETLSVSEYVSGLGGIAPRMNDIQRRVLVAQYNAPHRGVTSPQLAELANVDGGYPIVNAQYGRLGRMFLEQTGNQPDIRDDGYDRLWATWSIGYKLPDGWVWEMLPAVAEALEFLG
ncbi:MAG: hypothetical protein EXR98_19935 [Gemmataceae bacterium]|nr:hypothetical protein [Gemmataceae bacterium]